MPRKDELEEHVKSVFDQIWSAVNDGKHVSSEIIHLHTMGALCMCLLGIRVELSELSKQVERLVEKEGPKT